MARGPWRGPALPDARRALARAWTALMLGVLGVLGVLASAPARAQVAPISLNLLQAVRGDDGVWVSFDVNLRLTPAVEEALSKGVALYFVADARLVRYRWYWSDEVVGHVRRTWRLSYQPLTQEWRVRFGALTQSYDTLGAALKVMTRGYQWRIAESPDLDELSDYHVEFQYRLDTDELPRPLQIGLRDEADWNLSVQRNAPLLAAGAP